jgi:hypothetical protein
MSERRLPPVTQLGMSSLALIVASGIYLSAHLPQQVPLTPRSCCWWRRPRCWPATW